MLELPSAAVDGLIDGSDAALFVKGHVQVVQMLKERLVEFAHKALVCARKEEIAHFLWQVGHDTAHDVCKMTTRMHVNLNAKRTSMHIFDKLAKTKQNTK